MQIGAHHVCMTLAQICDELIGCTLRPTEAGIGVQLVEAAPRPNEIHEQSARRRGQGHQ